jgi:hypothetical protein
MMELDYDSYLAYMDGKYVQDAFPEMSPDEREMLITGTHPECWDKMWAHKFIPSKDGKTCEVCDNFADHPQHNL